MSDSPLSSGRRWELDQVVMPPAMRERARALVHQRRVARATIEGFGGDGLIPAGLIVVVSGISGTGKTVFASALAAEAGAAPEVLRHATIASDASTFRRACARCVDAEAPLVLDGCTSLDALFVDELIEIVSESGLFVVITVDEPRRLADRLWSRVAAHFTLEVPSTTQREQLWELHLPLEIPLADGIDIPQLASRFALTGAQVSNAVAIAAHYASSRAPDEVVLTMADLVAAAEEQASARPRVLDAALYPNVTTAELLLPEEVRARFDDLLASSRHRAATIESIVASPTSHALFALFDGVPGGGKTFAAHVLASALHRPLVVANVAYIGGMSAREAWLAVEERVELTHRTRALLLFDEADLLFAPTVGRGETLAQIILQTASSLETTVIFTSRTFGGEETALKRRLDWRISFPFPDAATRAALWRHFLPAADLGGETTEVAIDFAKLGRAFELAGAQIRKAAIRALTRAHAAEAPLTMQLLQEAGVEECQASGTLFRLEERAKPLADRSRIIKVTPAAVDASMLRAPVDE